MSQYKFGILGENSLLWKEETIEVLCAIEGGLFGLIGFITGAEAGGFVGNPPIVGLWGLACVFFGIMFALFLKWTYEEK